MKIRRALAWMGIGKDLAHLVDTVQKEAKVYSPLISLKKAGKGMAHALVGVVVTAVLAQLMDPNFVKQALSGVDPATAGAAVIFVTGLARFVHDWWDHS